jgi:hypothetical protein
MKKNYHHPAFVQHKKSPMNLFSIYHMKKNITQEKEKNLRGKKIKILIWGKKNFFFFKSVLEKIKQACFNKEN